MGRKFLESLQTGKDLLRRAVCREFPVCDNDGLWASPGLREGLSVRPGSCAGGCKAVSNAVLEARQL